MLHLSLIKLADGQRGIVKSCQQVSPDISYLCGITAKAIKDIFQMTLFQRKQAVLYLAYWNGFASDPDGLASAAQGIDYEFQYSVYIFRGILLAKARIIDL